MAIQLELVIWLRKDALANMGKERYGPKIWNLLPKDMRLESNTNDFKKKLKTYLIVSGEDLSQRLDCQ